jgi:hypothetical protein
MQVLRAIVCISFLCLFGVQSNASERFRVVDSDTQNGVRAYIDIIDVNQKKQRVSITGTDGYVQKDFTCALLETLIVTPIIHRAYYFSTFECPVSKNTISLKSNKRQVYLVKNAEWSFKEGDFGTAALAYTEAAYRLSSVGQDEQEALDLEVNAYLAAANYLSVSESTVFDVQQDKRVMSSQLKKAILDLQNEKGLKATGKLDFQTLSTMSSKSLPEVLFSPPEKN